MKIALDIGAGEPLEVDVKDSFVLGAHWWRWTEYRWDGPEGMRYQTPIADHRVLALGHPAELNGYLVIWLEAGSARAVTPHMLFPIIDEDLRNDGAAEAVDALLKSLAKQPDLFA